MTENLDKSQKDGENLYGRYVCSRCYNKPDECTCENFPPTCLIMIDEGVQYAIKTLNNKGYRTAYCCESHIPRDNMYIKFGHAMNKNIIPPEGFKFANSRSAIEHNYKGKYTEESFAIEKQKYLSILNEWVDNIPTNIIGS